MEDKWVEGWKSQAHEDAKKAIFNTVSNYVGPVGTMLDIGCGLAREASMFQKAFGTKLYLLDGDFDSTKDNRRDIKYGPVDNFKFYSKIDDLKKFWDSQDMDYTFVDANNILVDENVKFDLIYSAVSCGFHYPATTYKKLLTHHVHKDTKIILDIRKDSNQSGIEIINIVSTFRKYITAEIKVL